MVIRSYFFPFRFYSNLKKFSFYHTSKCRHFPRAINKNHNNFDPSTEIYHDEDLSLDIDHYDEYLMYQDMEINNLGSAIGARAWTTFTDRDSCPGAFIESTSSTYSRVREGIPAAGDFIPRVPLHQGLEQLLEEELKEKARIHSSAPSYLKLKNDNKQIDEHIPLSIGTIEKIKLSEELSKRSPSSKSGFRPKHFKDNRVSKRYAKMLERTDSHSHKDRYEFNDSTKSAKVGTKIHTVRVLNVDKLPLEILHHMVAYNIVKYMPAEKAIRLIWRIASYRDKRGDVPYQNLLSDTGCLTSGASGAELVALLSRAHQTVSIPFLVDYVRNFGTFSRSFIAKNLEHCAKPRAFDFIRYARFGGSRKLPLVIYQPRELLGYVHLLRNCSAKRYMLTNLKILGIVPNDYKFERYHAYGTLDEKLADSLLQSERLLTDPELPVENYKHEDSSRPPMYDLIMKASSLGVRVEDIVEDDMATNPILTKYAKKLHDSDEVDVKPTPVLSQLIPLVPPESNLEADKSSRRLELGYKNVDESIPVEGKRSWTLPWTVVDNTFTYKGKKYILDTSGWRIEENDDSKNWFRRSPREIRRKQSRKLRLKRLAIKLCKADGVF